MYKLLNFKLIIGRRKHCQLFKSFYYKLYMCTCFQVKSISSDCVCISSNSIASIIREQIAYSRRNVHWWVVATLHTQPLDWSVWLEYWCPGGQAMWETSRHGWGGSIARYLCGTRLLGSRPLVLSWTQGGRSLPGEVLQLATQHWECECTIINLPFGVYVLSLISSEHDRRRALRCPAVSWVCSIWPLWRPVNLTTWQQMLPEPSPWVDKSE